MKKNTILKILVILITLVVLTGTVSYFLLVGDAQKLKDHYPVYDSVNKSYRLVPKKPAHWVELNEISKELKFAIVISEDWAFYNHNGIDTNQIQIVIEENMRKNKLVRGASTITQQVVKNALLTNERSLFRKFKEVLLAKKLEKILSKDKILEHYLNLIELGENIYGVNKGSQFYFNKTPIEVNAKEGAFLAMLLPSPIKYGQSFKQQELTEFAASQVNKILVKMRQARIITEEQRVEYALERLSFEKEVEQEDNTVFEDEFEDEMENENPYLEEKEKMDKQAEKFNREDDLDLDENTNGEF